MIVKINISDDVTADRAMRAVGQIGNMVNWDIVKLDQMVYMQIGQSALSCKFSVSRAGNVFINVGKA